jgi:thiopurine S-methyltransferase
MDPDFWHRRWQEGQIGFHQPVINAQLQRHWPALGVAPGATVYVPLCGKSMDMVWLVERGHRVVGTELSSVAIGEFFAERALQPTVTQAGAYCLHVAGPYTLIEGDALALERADAGDVLAVYDRAALVALPASMRAAYAHSLERLLPRSARGLLIGFEYPQALRPGPPFAVHRPEVDALLGDGFEIREVERVDVIDTSPAFAAAGVPALWEVAYELQRR